MQLPQPYLYTSERMVAIIDRPQMAPSEGPIADPIFGYHTLWAAEIPFIPLRTNEAKGNTEKGTDSHIEHTLKRQVRFLYDLAQSRDYLATFEMRFVSWPQANNATRVGIAFLGKVFHTDAATSRQLALGLWDKFSALFPHEAPFSYPLAPIKQLDTRTLTEPHTFMDWFLPLPFADLSNPKSIVELRKYEDWPSIRETGNILHARDYIPHPFVPALDYSAIAGLLETLSRQQQITMVSITLRPQRLTDQEIIILHELAGWYKQPTYQLPEAVTKNRLIQQWRKSYGESINTYRNVRAKLGSKVYDELVHEHRSLFLVRLQVIGNPVAQDDVIEALGSEIMANAGNAYPSRWSRVEASSAEELRWARFNLQWLEFARWGISPLVQQDRRIIRLRQLATVTEIAGAFRLPIAPTTGSLTGIEVRHEPFTAPLTLPDRAGDVTLGSVVDRGVPINIRLSLTPDLRAGLVQIFGDKTAYRTQMVQALLSADAHTPRILLRLEGSSVQRLADNLSARHITLSSESFIDSLGFHPFLPPPNVSLTKFLDALLHMLMGVCALDPATISTLRRALHETYHNSGWTGQEMLDKMDLALLAAGIETIAQQAQLPTQQAMLLRTHCVPILQDLAFIIPPAQQKTFAHQAQITAEVLVIDIGWFGSAINNALIYSCLWMWYSLALAERPSAEPHLGGVLALEEAHTLFTLSPSVASFATLIQSNTQANIATLLIDTHPELLDNALSNQAALTILTRSSAAKTQEYVAQLIGATPAQKARIARMQATEAVVKIQGFQPVHIQPDRM